MSKRVKTLLSVAVSVALIFGLCPTAYADPVGSEKEDRGSIGSGEVAGNEETEQNMIAEEGSSVEGNVSSGNEESGFGLEESSSAESSGTNERESSESPKDEIEATDDEVVRTEPLPDFSTLADATSQDERKLVQAAEQDIPDGDYLIVSSVCDNRVLDVRNGSRQDSASIQTFTYNGLAAQKWRISHDENGYLVISNIGSGKVLDVRGARLQNGAQIQQYATNGTLAQRWVSTKNSDGTYTIASAMDNGKVIDISGASKAAGANVQLYSKNGSKAQRFEFKSLNPKVDSCPEMIEDGYYEILPTLNSGYALDVSGASLFDGANIQLYKRNGSFAQLFKFTFSNGFYQIQAASRKNVDVAQGGLLNGSNIQQYSPNNSNAQLWSVQKNADGSFTFISKANALAMDVCNGKASNGSNIQCYSYNGTRSQRFVLKKRANLIGDGIYTMRPAISSSRLLDVKDASSANGANVQLHSSNGSQAQKWSINLVPGRANVYTVRSVMSGKYLTLDSSGNVCQRSRSTDGSQYWKASISIGRAVFINEKYNKSLDISGASNCDGANVQGYVWNSTNAQRFVLEGTAILNNGTYAIKCAADSSQVLDVASGSRNNGANIQVYKSNNTGAQKWNITRNGDGTYRVVNAQSGKALDVSGGVAQSGRNVQQYQRNSTKAQKWLIVDNADGTFKLASALDRSLVLTIVTSPKNGANVCISKDGGLSTQKFRFGPTTYTEISYSGMPADQRAMLKKINGKSSGTQYLIAVNRATHKVGVFKGAAGRWSYQYYWSCVTGAPSTPTITGTFRTTGYKRAVLSTDSRAKKCTQIKGGYFFHTILSSTNELGKSLSHGCVRLAPLSAIWIYNNVGAGTTVVIY